MISVKTFRAVFTGVLLILSAAAQAQFTCTTNSGKITITKYTGSGGAVIVPGTINGWPVTGIAASAFRNSSNLTSVAIADSVTSIGDYAFKNCTNLTSAVLPSGLTSINLGLFQFCTNLTAVSIPGSITSIGNLAFEGCGITNLVISGAVTNVGMSTFYNCADLLGLYFCGNAPSGVGASMFSGDSQTIIYRLPDAAGWPPVPETWAGRPTALWQQSQNPDADSDGIPDSWEQQYFGGTGINPNTISSNGFNTVLETYIAGLNPGDPAAYFGITNHTGNIIQWNAVSGRVYSVYWTTDLLTGFQPLGTNFTFGAVTDSLNSAASRCFYKIDVRLAP